MREENQFPQDCVSLPDWLEAQLKFVENGLRNAGTRIVSAKRIAAVLQDRLNPPGFASVKRKINSQHVWLVIHELRRRGCPIGSNMKGYFWARKKSDLAAPLENLRNRRSGLCATIEALESAQQLLPE
jgi:hypothetical protein